MFTWPENILPLPSQNFDVDVEVSNIRSKMDSGRVRQRPRFTRELELSNVTFELNRIQFAAFKGVWIRQLNLGNDWFTMRLPIADGEELTLSEIRFVSDYTATHRPVGNWDISAAIEYRDTGELSQQVLDVLILQGLDLQGFYDSVNSLEEEISHFENDHTWG